MEQHTSSVKGFADSKAEGLTDKLLHHPPVLRGDQEVVGQRLPMDAHGLPRAEFQPVLHFTSTYTARFFFRRHSC